MTRYDLSPFFRSTIGFDHLANMMDQLDRAATSNASYPPYNIEKLDENAYRISMAVAGFTEAEIDITAHENTLLIKGSQDNGKDREFLHRGIATRGFEQRFQLADYVEVKEAAIENGMLHIDLVREVPEKLQPKKIAIKSGKSLLGKTKSISGKKAA